MLDQRDTKIRVKKGETRGNGVDRKGNKNDVKRKKEGKEGRKKTNKNYQKKRQKRGNGVDVVEKQQ